MASCTTFVGKPSSLYVSRNAISSGKVYRVISFDDNHSETVTLHSPSDDFLQALIVACTKALEMEQSDEFGRHDIEIAAVSVQQPA